MRLGLVERMKEQGIGVAELARRLGVSEKTVCRWRVGEKAPREDRLELLAQALGVSLDELDELLDANRLRALREIEQRLDRSSDPGERRALAWVLERVG